jgi:hypothetical protein
VDTVFTSMPSLPATEGRTVSSIQTEAVKEWFQTFENSISPFGHPYGSAEQLQDAICRTLIMDRERDDQGRLQRVHQICTSVLNVLCSPAKLSNSEKTYTEQKDLVDYLARVNFSTQKRRAFVTKRGYLGIGPVHLEPGDSIVILLGAAVPFVLRNVDEEKYKLVGEAYVHGVMDGEYANDQSKVETIQIC